MTWGRSIGPRHLVMLQKWHPSTQVSLFSLPEPTTEPSHYLPAQRTMGTPICCACPPNGQTSRFSSLETTSLTLLRSSFLLGIVSLQLSVELQRQFLALRRAGAFRHVLSSHTGSSLLYLVWELRSHPFYLIKSICNCTSAAPISSVPSVKRSTSTQASVSVAPGQSLPSTSRS